MSAVGAAAAVSPGTGALAVCDYLCLRGRQKVNLQKPRTSWCGSPSSPSVYHCLGIQCGSLCVELGLLFSARWILLSFPPKLHVLFISA